MKGQSEKSGWRKKRETWAVQGRREGKKKTEKRKKEQQSIYFCLFCAKVDQKKWKRIKTTIRSIRCKVKIEWRQEQNEKNGDDQRKEERETLNKMGERRAGRTGRAGRKRRTRKRKRERKRPKENRLLSVAVYQLQAHTKPGSQGQRSLLFCCLFPLVSLLCLSFTSLLRVPPPYVISVSHSAIRKRQFCLASAFLAWPSIMLPP